MPKRAAIESSDQGQAKKLPRLSSPYVAMRDLNFPEPSDANVRAASWCEAPGRNFFFKPTGRSAAGLPGVDESQRQHLTGLEVMVSELQRFLSGQKDGKARVVINAQGARQGILVDRVDGYTPLLDWDTLKEMPYKACLAHAFEKWRELSQVTPESIEAHARQFTRIFHTQVLLQDPDPNLTNIGFNAPGDMVKLDNGFGAYGHIRQMQGKFTNPIEVLVSSLPALRQEYLSERGRLALALQELLKGEGVAAIVNKRLEVFIDSLEMGSLEREAIKGFLAAEIANPDFTLFAGLHAWQKFTYPEALGFLSSLLGVLPVGNFVTAIIGKAYSGFALQDLFRVLTGAERQAIRNRAEALLNEENAPEEACLFGRRDWKLKLFKLSPEDMERLYREDLRCQQDPGFDTDSFHKKIAILLSIRETSLQMESKAPEEAFDELQAAWGAMKPYLIARLGEFLKRHLSECYYQRRGIGLVQSALDYLLGTDALFNTVFDALLGDDFKRIAGECVDDLRVMFVDELELPRLLGRVREETGPDRLLSLLMLYQEAMRDGMFAYAFGRDYVEDAMHFVLMPQAMLEHAAWRAYPSGPHGSAYIERRDAVHYFVKLQATERARLMEHSRLAEHMQAHGDEWLEALKRDVDTFVAANPSYAKLKLGSNIEHGFFELQMDVDMAHPDTVLQQALVLIP